MYNTIIIIMNRLSLPPTSSHLPQSFSSYNPPDPDHHIPSHTKPELLPLPHTTSSEEPINPLPLPPKDRKSSVTSGGKRHTRKNPLIIPSGMAASMARRAEATDNAANDNIPGNNRSEQLYAQSSMSSLSDLPIAGT